MKIIRLILFWAGVFVMLGSSLAVYSIKVKRLKNLISRNEAMHTYISLLIAIIVSFIVIELAIRL